MYSLLLKQFHPWHLTLLVAGIDEQKSYILLFVILH